jgi:hypothetical protein
LGQTALYTHTHTHTYIYIHTSHIYIYIYIYIYTYTYIHTAQTTDHLLYECELLKTQRDNLRATVPKSEGWPVPKHTLLSKYMLQPWQMM